MLHPVRVPRNADIRIGGHVRAAPGEDGVRAPPRRGRRAGAPGTGGPPPMTDNPVWSNIAPSAGGVPDRHG